MLNFLCLAILFKTCLKNLHSLSYQGLEGKLFFMFFHQFDLCCFIRNNGDIAFSNISLKISHRLSLLHPSASAHGISSNAIHVCSFSRDAWYSNFFHLAIYKGFCQVTTNPKIREKLGSGWVGQAITMILIFFLEMLCFLCYFHVSNSFQKTEKIR